MKRGRECVCSFRLSCETTSYSYWSLPLPQSDFVNLTMRSKPPRAAPRRSFFVEQTEDRIPCCPLYFWQLSLTQLWSNVTAVSLRTRAVPTGWMQFHFLVMFLSNGGVEEILNLVHSPSNFYLSIPNRDYTLFLAVRSAKVRSR